MQTLTSLRVERDLSRQLVSLAAIHSKHATERRKIGWVFAALLLTMALLTGASAQITPSQDAYTNTADPTTNYGAKTLLDVESASQNSYIQFDLSSIPAGYTGSSVAKATLKLYVNAVKAGSFNVDYVNGTWTEATIDANNAPALGSTIAASVPLTTADKNQYILIDVTSAVQAWLNGTANDGIALVGNSPLNASFDSKESTSTSHAAELDIVFAGGNGTITGIDTAAGSGLIGGGTSGTLSLSLTNACAANQVLQWNGTAWVCVNLKGGGTITGVTAGTDLTGGGNSGNVTLNLDTTKVPQLASNNTFTGAQTIYGLVYAAANVPSGGFLVSGANQSATGGGVLGQGGTYGVYGTGGLAGVYGQGNGSVTGVYGSSPTGVGVSGTTTGGTGVSGTAAASTGGTGVYGENQSYSVGGDGIIGRAHTSSGNGVHGINDATLAVGVYGENSASNGYGVYGHAPNGYGMATDSNATQARSMGGWVKAMVYVDPFNGGIQRCFNSQLPGSQATTVPCGMTYTYLAAGEYLIDFGFQVDDRFLQVSTTYNNTEISSCAADSCSGLSATQVYVIAAGGFNGDAPFFLTVF